MGWRTATTLCPSDCKTAHTWRVVWLLPLPVRPAHTDTTGLRLFSCVEAGPISRKSAPAAIASDALCMTYSCDTSL